MSTVNKVLLPFDFLEASIHALDYTLHYIGYNRPIQIIALWVCEVQPSEKDREDLEKRFDTLLGELDRKVSVKPVIRISIGRLTDQILSAQKEYGAELIVMGTMGQAQTDEAVTHTSQLVLEADSPVMAIPFGCPVDVPTDVALVLGREEIEDDQILAPLLDVARTFDARIHVLTVYSDSIIDEKMAENAVTRKNEKILSYYFEHFYEDHVFLKGKDIEHAIMEFIKEKEIDMLCIMPRNHNQRGRPSEGRLTRILTLHSPVPLLTLD